MLKELSSILPLPRDFSDHDTVAHMDPEEITNRITDHARNQYDDLEQQFTSETLRSIERQLMLRVIDVHWLQHLTAMENLRQGIGLHAYGQRDPLVMYKKEGHDLFQNLQNRIQHDIVHTIYHVSISPATHPSNRRAKRSSKVVSGVASNLSNKTSSTKVPKVGRNELCPCGSNKKYKRCHGA